MALKKVARSPLFSLHFHILILKNIWSTSKDPKIFSENVIFCSQIWFQLNMCIFVLVHHVLFPIVTIRADTYI